MLPILFEVGQLKFYSFGSFIALGTIVAGFFIYRAARGRNLKTHHLFDTVLYSLLFALIGARVSYYFVYQNQFQNFGQLFFFWQGGLVALGGLLAGFLTFLYHARKVRDPIWQLLDIGALALILAWSIGKFGCFLSSCSIGRDAENFLSVNGSYPVDLFISVWSLLLFAVMLVIWLRNKLSDGVVFFLAMEGLFLGQLLINTLKADFGEGIVRVEAIINLALIVALYLLFWKLHGPKVEKRRFGVAVKNFVFRKRS